MTSINLNVSIGQLDTLIECLNNSDQKLFLFDSYDELFDLMIEARDAWAVDRLRDPAYRDAFIKELKA